ncbi:MAG: hypothetical protein U0166_05070 [Acidobacteriota bacterium]
MGDEPEVVELQHARRALQRVGRSQDHLRRLDVVGRLLEREQPLAELLEVLLGLLGELRDEEAPIELHGSPRALA